MTEVTRLKRRLEDEFDAVRKRLLPPGRRAARRKRLGSTSASASMRSFRLMSPTSQGGTCQARRRRVPRAHLGDMAPSLGRRVASAWLIRRFIDPDAKFAGSPSPRTARSRRSASTSMARPPRRSAIVSP